MFTSVVIDDERWTLVDIKKTFPWGANGFAVVGETTNPLEGVELIRSLRPDFVLVDMKMPALNGMELIREIRSEGNDAEVIVVSGFASFDYAKKMMEYGAFAYCLKPLNRKDCEDVFARLRERLLKKGGNRSVDPILFMPENIVHKAFSQMLRTILRDYAKPLSLSVLSEQLGLNPNYCCSLFTQHLQMTFSQYVTRVRLAHAKERLLLGADSGEEIASAVGFDNYSYFSKVFKKHTGVAPSEFRRTGGEGDRP